MADDVFKDHTPSLSAWKPMRGWRVGYPLFLSAVSCEAPVSGRA